MKGRQEQFQTNRHSFRQTCAKTNRQRQTDRISRQMHFAVTVQRCRSRSFSTHILMITDSFTFAPAPAAASETTSFSSASNSTRRQKKKKCPKQQQQTILETKRSVNTKKKSHSAEVNNRQQRLAS
uniref:Uncharacterized protein n=1 Tax=Syphacia muris TaxID=451379 RepID=A0A0N5AQC6_9BILA